MTPVVVRPGTEADLPAIVEIYIRAYAQPPWNEQHGGPARIASEGYLRWVSGLPETHCLVSLADSAVAGFVLAGPRAYADFVGDWERLAERPASGWPVLLGRLGYIWEVAVDPPLQGRGHGTTLLGAAVEQLRASGTDIVVLRSSERATTAIRLYRRFGFQRLPVRERYDPLSGPWILPLHPPSPGPPGPPAAGS